ncbi:hypothetical protein Nepgr_012353 [Nepenthes gracilis]|uniref:Uncharacterized protein n=1 Tax=Nepenthes gracilis TaxID=150966 RepID=A0AAD3XMQ8_NEPGR|nr:hypothetical protein Nepgr_012353 [Nepenthes gracilis]
MVLSCLSTCGFLPVWKPLAGPLLFAVCISSPIWKPLVVPLLSAQFEVFSDLGLLSGSWNAVIARGWCSCSHLRLVIDSYELPLNELPLDSVNRSKELDAINASQRVD